MKRKTREFKLLREHWYQQLKELGFDDIEVNPDQGDYLKVWHSSYFQSRYTPGSFSQKQIYYEIASDLLHQYEFKTPEDRAIWELYTSGFSIRQIARELGITACRAYKTVRTLSKLVRGMESEDGS